MLFKQGYLVGNQIFKSRSHSSLSKAAKTIPVRYHRMTDRENRRLHYSHVIHLKRKDIALQCSRENNNATLQA